MKFAQNWSKHTLEWNRAKKGNFVLLHNPLTVEDEWARCDTVFACISCSSSHRQNHKKTLYTRFCL